MFGIINTVAKCFTGVVNNSPNSSQTEGEKCYSIITLLKKQTLFTAINITAYSCLLVRDSYILPGQMIPQFLRITLNQGMHISYQWGTDRSWQSVDPDHTAPQLIRVYLIWTHYYIYMLNLNLYCEIFGTNSYGEGHTCNAQACECVSTTEWVPNISQHKFNNLFNIYP